jgi:hypothetical protein
LPPRCQLPPDFPSIDRPPATHQTQVERRQPRALSRVHSQKTTPKGLEIASNDQGRQPAFVQLRKDNPNAFRVVENAEKLKTEKLK